MKTTRFAIFVVAGWFAVSPVVAQDAGSGYLEKTFSSFSRAVAAAEGRGMVMAKDFHGNLRFVTPAVAAMLERQGFRYDSRGVLFGYGAGVSDSGLGFLAGAPALEAGSYEVSIGVEDKPDGVEEEDDVPPDECDPQLTEGCGDNSLEDTSR